MNRALLSRSAAAAVYLATASLGLAASFDGAADNQTDAHGYYYAVGGGLFPNGQARNGDNASGGTIRFITDDPSWGFPTDAWQKDDWFPVTSSLALTMTNSGTVVFDNNGIETNSVPADFYAWPSLGVVTGYSMSNNFDWIYAGYFHLNDATTVDQITGYFTVSHDPTQPNPYNFDPADPNVRFHANIFSEVAGQLPKNTGSFAGDVFTSDTTPGTFSFSDTGYDRVGSTGIVNDIYRLTYTLDAPVTLAAGDYYFSHDASLVPLPASAWGGLALLGGLALAHGAKRVRGQRA